MGRGGRSRLPFPSTGLAAVGLHGAEPCRAAPRPRGLTVTFSHSQKAEGLRPCLKWGMPT